MPQETATLQQMENISKPKNTLLIILIILVVALFGILIGLVAFLLTTRNSNNNQVSISSSSSTTKSLNSTTLTNISTNSTTSNSDSSTTLSNSTMSSSIPFSHNEGKYIRFDYPTGWKVDVSSTRSDGTFNKFEDIGDITIQKDNNRISLNFMGGFGCGGGSEWSILKNDLNIFTNYSLDVESTSKTTIPVNYNIKNFVTKKLSLPTSKDVYLVSFNFTSSNDFTYNFSKTNGLYRALAYFDGNKYSNISCNTFLELDKLNVVSEIKILMINLSNEQPLDFDYTAQVIERFTNSFQKK